MIAGTQVPDSAFANRMLPHDSDSERALLGSMILSRDSMAEATDMIGSEAFHEGRHQVIWEAFRRMRERGSPADVALVKAQLFEMGDLENVGGIEYLVELAESVPCDASWRWYLQCVQASYRRRQLIIAADAMQRTMYEGGDVDAAIETMLTEAAAAQLITRRQPELVGEVALRVLNDALERDETSGIRTGLRSLDAKLGTMRPGQMIVLGARPSMGKTALALTISRKIAATGVPVLFLSLEMSTDELVGRFYSMESGVRYTSIMQHRPDKADGERLMQAYGALESLPVHVHYCAGASITEIQSLCAGYVARKGIRFVVIDYLQLVGGKGDAGHREAEVACVSRGIKTLAGQCGVPILALAQLNRAAEASGSKMPGLANLRESGSIEQDADVVMMLHRDDAYNWMKPEFAPNNEALVMICKQRNGPTGLVRLNWVPEQMMVVEP